MTESEKKWAFVKLFTKMRESYNLSQLSKSRLHAKAGTYYQFVGEYDFKVLEMAFEQSCKHSPKFFPSASSVHESCMAAKRRIEVCEEAGEVMASGPEGKPLEYVTCKIKFLKTLLDAFSCTSLDGLPKEVLSVYEERWDCQFDSWRRGEFDAEKVMADNDEWVRVVSPKEGE